MIGLLPNYIIPGALSVMPAKMNSPQAGAMLYAIALQETKVMHRLQVKGPAVSLWQYEYPGIEDVINDRIVGPIFDDCLESLLYRRNLDIDEIKHILIHNDFVACCLARCKLWKLPMSLPLAGQEQYAWSQYIRAWKPGKPRPDDWPENYTAAWDYFGKVPHITDVKKI